MTYQEFKDSYYTEILPVQHKDLREGQGLMIYLNQIWTDEYNRLSSIHYYDRTDIDCFYNDKLIPNTLKHLEKVWDNYPN